MATCVLGDCDHDVKTVAIKAGEIPSGADLEDNKTATINVSTYTEPVEIEPTEGKDGMKKATVTLSNIPSGGDSGVYIWTENAGGTQESTSYLNIDKAPSATEANSIKKLSGSLDGNLHSSPIIQNGYTYNYVSDTEFTVNIDLGNQTLIVTYTRNENVHIWD